MPDRKNPKLFIFGAIILILTLLIVADYYLLITGITRKGIRQILYSHSSRIDPNKDIPEKLCSGLLFNSISGYYPNKYGSLDELPQIASDKGFTVHRNDKSNDVFMFSFKKVIAADEIYEFGYYTDVSVTQLPYLTIEVEGNCNLRDSYVKSQVKKMMREVGFAVDDLIDQSPIETVTNIDL